MEFRRSKSKILGIALAAVGFVVLGVWLIGTDSAKAQIAGWVTIVFFGFGVAVLVWQLFKSGDEACIVIDEQGIVDKRTKVGVIPWSDVSRVWIGNIHSQKLLCVETHSKSQSLSEFATRSNAALGLPPIAIGFSGLNPGLDAAIDHIRAVQPSKLST